LRNGEKGLALVALVGGLHIGYVQLIGPPHDPRTDATTHVIDQRYASVRQELAAVPEREAISYLETNGLEKYAGSRRMGEASYALAPRILLPDDGKAPLVLLDLERPDQLADVEQRAALHLVWSSADGVVALARRGGR